MLQAEVAALREKYANSTERANPGRGHRILNNEAAVKLQSLLKDILPDGAKDMTNISSDSPIAKHIKPIVFAITAGRETHNQETGHLSTIRLRAAGTRQMVALASVGLTKYLQFKSDSKAMRQLKVMKDELKVLTPPGLKGFGDFGDGSKVLRGTLGPQDALHIPHGWSFSKQVGQNHDVFGMRLQFLRKEDLPGLEAINDILIGMEKPSECFQMAVDYLTLLA